MSAHRLLAVAGLAVAAAACGSGETTFESASVEVIDEPATASESAVRLDSPELTCDEQAALFVAGPSVNPDLAAPESSAVCVGDNIVITSNGIPDYTYIETSPGSPQAGDLQFTIPADPEVAATTTAVPALGTAAVSLTGIPIYGPTEGTGGDVLSLVGALSECGSHNGPTGFHIHLFGTSATTDCLFTPEAAAAAPQLLGYALDGYPIYTGNDQYTSSWELTDASLFATDTWAAHSYVEGSGDLDECNGLVDESGNYAYYTTDTFPYVLGCYTGVVDLAAAGGGGGGGGGGGPAGGGPGGGAPRG
ncbi:MAG: YHYH protein [Actinomycetota bacterium]